jgi:TonB-linked SusC/RagA family outer membrane protein
MKWTLRLLGAVIFSLLLIPVFAQTNVVSGTVLEDDGTPLVGATVTNKSNNKRTQTNLDGKFTLAASKGDVITITSVGYVPKSYTVGDDKSFSLKVSKTNAQLNEVLVTTAFGIKRNNNSLGFSTQTVSGAEIAETQRENFFNSLQGRVAGATVNTTSGAPGASSQIILRGFNSASQNNSALIVVDGMPINNNTFGQGFLASDIPNRNQDYQNRAADINPDDIESMTILKGPEAAALYGIEAGSGAIIITTKKGKSKKLQVSYDNSFRVEEIFRFPQTQSVYDNGLNGQLDPFNFERRGFGAKYPANATLYNNVENFFQRGFSQKHNIALEWGKEKVNFRLSATYTDWKGTVPGTSLKKINTRFSLNAKPSKQWGINASVAFTNTENFKALRGAGGFLFDLLRWPKDDDVREYLTFDGKRRFVSPRVVSGSTTIQQAEQDNPFFSANRNVNFDNNGRMIFNGGLNFDANSWLSFSWTLGGDFYSTKGTNFIHPESNSGIAIGGRVEEYNQRYLGFTSMFVGNIKKQFGKTKHTLRLGLANDQYDISSFGSFGERVVDTNSTKLFGNVLASSIRNSRTQGRDTITQRRAIGVLFDYNFNYDDFFFVNISGRNDWSSSLPTENRSFFYPAVNTSLILSNLIAKNSNVLKLWKIRGAYASVARDVVPYSDQAVFIIQPTSGNGVGLNFFVNNPKLEPEFQKTYELGTEFKFFKNENVGLEVTYYNTNTANQILRNARLSYGTGGVLKTINALDVTSQGIEAVLTVSPVLNKNFRWTMNFNFSKNWTNVNSIIGNLPEYYNSDTWLGDYRASLFSGSPLATIGGADYLRNTKGQILIDPATGYPLLDPFYRQIADRTPDFQLGFQNRITIDNFSFSFLLDLRVGGDIYNGTEQWLMQNGYSTRTVNREKPIIYPGVFKDGLEESATPTANNIPITPHLVSDWYVNRSVAVDFVEKDINWLRCRDITFRYSLGPKVLNKISWLQNASFFVTGTDLFIFTNYSGVDPTVNGNTPATGGVGTFGIDFGQQSSPRGVNFGLVATFKSKK